jgi:DNA-binding protein HU-beta
MNRKELVAAVALKTGLSIHDAAAAVTAVTEAVVGGVADDGSVVVPGFGTFEARDRAARTGRNPQTGESMEIPASRVVAFKAATAFRREVAAGN